MKKFYSIIIPVFNEENKIPSLLLNLKRYSDEGHEIIIIDDGSWDNSYKILSESKSGGQSETVISLDSKYCVGSEPHCF